MKSAEYDARASSALRYGAPNCANGIEPESNQASITCGTRRYVPDSPGRVNVTSSTNGRCGSSSSTPESSRSSASDPTQIIRDGSSSLRHTGRGVPQKRSRDNDQSMLLFNQSP